MFFHPFEFHPFLDYIQVMLYDDCGKLLASRFLKKDEVVESGVELAFDTHLVDIGDPEENSKPQIVLNVQGDKQSIGKIGTIGQEVGHNSSVGIIYTLILFLKLSFI